MSYLDEGAGEGIPTLFLHGNPTWSFFYRNLILSFREKGRCVAPDHIGCGLSDKPDDKDFSYLLKQHAQNISELLDHLEINKLNLVVHDWGGAIGMTALASTPERINKIVLFNTAAFLSKDVAKRILFCRLPLVGEFFVRALNGFAWPATWMATAKELDSKAKEGFLFPYNSWKNRVAIWNFVQDIPYENNHRSHSVLQETENKLKDLAHIPSIACWGMKDFCFHPGFLHKWQTFWPNMKAHFFPDAGHYLLEDNFEEVVSKVEPFLFEV